MLYYSCAFGSTASISDLLFSKRNLLANHFHALESNNKSEIKKRYVNDYISGTPSQAGEGICLNRTIAAFVQIAFFVKEIGRTE